MLPDVGCDNFTVLRCGIVKYPLDQVIAILVARDVDQGNAGSVTSTFAHSI
jgi:hypothetical protein